MSESGRTALIVDDEEIIQYILTLSLEEIGYDCVAVGSGDEALSQMAARRFHVVLLDIRMPGRNGYEVLKAVRSGYPNTCVIMISALEDPDLVTRVFTTLGAAGFIAKPWRIDKVADADSRYRSEAVEHCCHDPPQVRASRRHTQSEPYLQGTPGCPQQMPQVASVFPMCPAVKIAITSAAELSAQTPPDLGVPSDG